jgi:hypothetical protein
MSLSSFSFLLYNNPLKVCKYIVGINLMGISVLKTIILKGEPSGSVAGTYIKESLGFKNHNFI